MRDERKFQSMVTTIEREAVRDQVTEFLGVLRKGCFFFKSLVQNKYPDLSFVFIVYFLICMLVLGK